MIKSDGHTLKHSNFSKEKSHISVLLRYELYIKVKFSKIYIYIPQISQQYLTGNKHSFLF